MTPDARAACAAATVTPPAVSEKTPSVAATVRIAAAVTSSGIASIEPLVRRASSSA